MRIYGVDFTSAPGRRKPITWAVAQAGPAGLVVERVDHLPNWDAFQAALALPGPWVAGFDFPFAQSRRFVENIGWPTHWPDMVAHVASLTRAEFRAQLEAYKAPRAAGDREHPRRFEAGTGAASPQKLYGVPVGLMFYEGARRLAEAGLHLPGLRPTSNPRVGVEVYPGLAARALLGGRVSYKTEGADRPGLLAARRGLVAALCGAPGRARFGFAIHLPPDIAQDPKADGLDACLCAVQAAWAYACGLTRQGPQGLDPLEGWIADPALITESGAARPFQTR